MRRGRNDVLRRRSPARSHYSVLWRLLLLASPRRAAQGPRWAGAILRDRPASVIFAAQHIWYTRSRLEVSVHGSHKKPVKAHTR